MNLHIQSATARRIRASAVIFLAFGFAGASYAQDISDSALRDIAALLAEKASRTPSQQKMTSSLVHASKILKGDPIPAGLPISPHALDAVHPDAANRVEVEIQGAVTPALLSSIQNTGGTIVLSSPDAGSIHAIVPLLALEQIASLNEVRQIRTLSGKRRKGQLHPSPVTAAQREVQRQRIAFQMKNVLARLAPTPSGTPRASGAGSDTTGDIAHQANYVRSNFGFTGAGVKIGVVSDGVDSASLQEALGYLPAVTVLPFLGGSGDEGTALLEILYTLAPGATLYFATNGQSELQMANAMQGLANAGCNIILDDTSFIAEPVFQDGIIASKVNQLTAAGVLCFSAEETKGNALLHTGSTWQGDFSPSTVTLGLPEAGTFHNFGGLTYDVVTGTIDSLYYQLNWADPQGASTNDYDLFALDPTGTRVVASSTNVQNGTSDPHEEIDDYYYDIRDGSRIVIVKKPTAATLAIWLNMDSAVLSTETNGAVWGHAAAAGAFTIAATDVANAKGGAFTGGSADQVETFSSDGPRRMFFNPDGSPITPGNFLFATNGGLLLNKPDFTAADDVPSGLTDYNPFSGTSAATPHAAAIAALVMQAVPAITPAQMRSAMIAASLRVGTPGFDPDSGAGVVMAPAAVLAAAGVQITITSTPFTGLTFAVSGTACTPGTYTSPATFTWITGTTCQVRWLSPQGSAPYSFVRWQDNSSQNPQTFTVPRVATTYTATFVQGTTLPGVPATVSLSVPGLSFSVDGVSYTSTQSFRWDTGSMHTLNAPSPQSLAGTLYLFQSWSNAGAQSQTVTASASVSAYTATFVTFSISNPTISAISHFAAGGTWTTGFLVSNTSTTKSALFTMAFFGDAGTPLSIPYGGNSVTSLSGVIPAQGSAYYESSNPLIALAAGWAQISSDPTIVIQALFRNDANGTYYEAAVPAASKGSKEFLMPFDATTFVGNSQPFYTGFAVANLDALTANINCTARDPNGVIIPGAVSVPALAPMGHWANYLFPSLVGMRGTIDCVSSNNIAATALRFIGTNAFSSLPVTYSPTSYSGAATSAIAHFAAGDTWTTGFFVMNTGPSAAQFSVVFRDDQGNPATLPFNAGPAKGLSSLLSGYGSAYIEAADPSSPLVSGWGQVTADPTIVFQALFRDNASGTYYEAAVPSSVGSKEFVMPFDATTFAANGLPFYTGFAIANLDSSAATITCTARDPNGVVIPSAVTVPTIAALGHWANYLFPALTGLRGTIDCVSTTNIAATALRFIGTNAFSSLQVTYK